MEDTQGLPAPWLHATAADVYRVDPVARHDTRGVTRMYLK